MGATRNYVKFLESGVLGELMELQGLLMRNYFVLVACDVEDGQLQNRDGLVAVPADAKNHHFGPMHVF